MSLKMPTIETFMVKEDERRFSEILREKLPQVVFVDLFCWPDSEPRIYSSLDECSSFMSALLNTAITPISDYKSQYVAKSQWHEYYEGSPVGAGLIQYLRSEAWNQNHKGLQNGRLAASYELPKEYETDTYVKEVYKLFKKFAVKLYWLNPETWETSERYATKFFAGPEAVRQYDRVNGQYLINNTMAYFSSIKST
jgi:hypothetical protein